MKPLVSSQLEPDGGRSEFRGDAGCIGSYGGLATVIVRVQIARLVACSRLRPSGVRARSVRSRR